MLDVEATTLFISAMKVIKVILPFLLFCTAQNVCILEIIMDFISFHDCLFPFAF